MGGKQRREVEWAGDGGVSGWVFLLLSFVFWLAAFAFKPSGHLNPVRGKARPLWHHPPSCYSSVLGFTSCFLAPWIWGTNVFIANSASWEGKLTVANPSAIMPTLGNALGFSWVCSKPHHFTVRLVKVPSQRLSEAAVISGSKILRVCSIYSFHHGSEKTPELL